MTTITVTTRRTIATKTFGILTHPRQHDQCDEFLKEQEKDNDNNDNDFQEEFELLPEEEPEFEDEVTGKISSS